MIIFESCDACKICIIQISTLKNKFFLWVIFDSGISELDKNFIHQVKSFIDQHPSFDDCLFLFLQRYRIYLCCHTLWEEMIGWMHKQLLFKFYLKDVRKFIKHVIKHVQLSKSLPPNTLYIQIYKFLYIFLCEIAMSNYQI